MQVGKVCVCKYCKYVYASWDCKLGMEAYASAQVGTQTNLGKLSWMSLYNCGVVGSSVAQWDVALRALALALARGTPVGQATVQRTVQYNGKGKGAGAQAKGSGSAPAR